MCSPFELAAMTVELRHNTSKSSFESSASGNKHRTRSSFVSTFHCRSPSKWKQEETVWIHVRTSQCPMHLEGNHLMPGKPYQSMLIPYEEEILSLRRQRPPVALRPNRRTPQGEVPGFHSAGCDLQVCESARTMEKEGSPREPTRVQDLEHGADSFVSTSQRPNGQTARTTQLGSN